MSGTDPAVADQAEITVYPDGPLLVRGPVRIQTPDGVEIVNSRATRALCRCGHSALKPWCDGTHKVVRNRRAQPADPASTGPAPHPAPRP